LLLFWVDNNAIADGFQIYLHGFVLNTTGEWAIVQPGIERPAPCSLDAIIGIRRRGKTAGTNERFAVEPGAIGIVEHFIRSALRMTPAAPADINSELVTARIQTSL
jgi:hypothetical protein